MPFQGSFEVQAGKEYGFYELPIRYIYDTFSRPSGVLGISTNAQLWTILRGSWYVNNSYQAEDDDSLTDYNSLGPLTTYDLVDTNQLGYANVSPGMGIAFNMQDANNWYALVSYNTAGSYNCNCSTCSYCNTCTYGCTTACNCGQCAGYFTTTSTNTNPNPGCCSVWALGPPSWTWSCCYTCSYNCTTAANCANCGTTYYSCNCSTCYNYTYNIGVLSCVSGHIARVSSLNLTQDAASISVQTLNKTVSFYAYSTNISGIITRPDGLGTLLGSGTYTITGPMGTQIGMVKSYSPTVSGVSQGTTISGFYGTGI